ncbi:MAG: alanine:cation symporter family protein [Oscillospiraceae bacterium]|nr:alanine:cation symporter family protein [Oscillospiraceae bacterium]
MEKIVEIVSAVNDKINGVVWGVPMLILIVCTGIYMTIRTGVFQIRRAKEVSGKTIFAIFKNKSVTKSNDKKAISQFQALSTALAATIGTGNIAGVATALVAGGPGAVFWMWVSAFFGMMTKFSENVLGIYFRKKNEDGEWAGGPMYYLENGVKHKKVIGKIAKPLAVMFAIFCVLASFGIGNMAQINSISSSMKVSFNIPSIITGVVLAVIAGFVIVGGIQRIGKVTEKLVPFMALAYIIGALIIFFTNFKQIPYVFGSIFTSAFSFNAALGGVAGSAVKLAVTMGFKRGVFSNEAGLGSSVLVNTSSNVKEPVVQGMWGIFEVFADTIVVCTLTAFVLLSSTVKTGDSNSLEEALSKISTKPQYVELVNGEDYEGAIPLIDKNSAGVYENYDGEGEYETFAVKTNDGKEFEIKLAKRYESKDDSDYVYTNIMEVVGVENEEGEIDRVKFSQVNGVPLVTYAFSKQFGSFAGKFLSIAILLFAFSTVLGWSFYGTKAIEYLLGKKATVVYKVIFVLFIVVGATMTLDLAWELADTFNALMAIPNLIGVLSLSGLVVKITRNYVDRKITKKTPDAKPMLSVYPDIQEEQQT